MEALIGNNTSLIEWVTVQNKTCLKFTYSQILTEREARRIGELWLNDFDNSGDSKFNLLFDCKTASNYQLMMKYFWNILLVKLKDRIDQIWVLKE